jgi:hypothetical protein
MTIRAVTPIEIAQEINKLNPKKAPGINKISPTVFHRVKRLGVIFKLF